MTTLTNSAGKSVGRPKWLSYILHGVSVLVGLAFLMAGVTKLMGQEMHVENYIRWGYPNWFMYINGTIEVLGAILIVIPATRFYGALLLVATMLGAIFTHIQSNEPAMLPLPIVLLLLSGFVAWMNRPNTGDQVAE